MLGCIGVCVCDGVCAGVPVCGRPNKLSVCLMAYIRQYADVCWGPQPSHKHHADAL